MRRPRRKCVGEISRVVAEARADRMAGRPPATARQRGETQQLHGFYLRAYRRFRWTRGGGFPQQELPFDPQPEPAS